MIASIASVSTLPLRARALEQRLRGEPREVALALSDVVARAAQGATPERDVLVAFAHLRATRPEPRLYATLARSAADLPLAAALLGNTPARRAILVRPQPRTWAFAYRGLSLGRESWSPRALRVRTASLRENVLSDPRAEVITRAITEQPMDLRDVLRVASRRPCQPEVTLAVARTPWIRDVSVREALVQNPYAPPWLAMSLLPTVRRALLELGPTHADVRAFSRALDDRG